MRSRGLGFVDVGGVGDGCCGSCWLMGGGEDGEGVIVR